MHKLTQSITRLIVTIILGALLVACQGPNGPLPTKSLIKKAIALELTQTQQYLSEQLRLSQPLGFVIKGVQIQKTESLDLEALPTFHILGSYDLEMKLSQHSIHQKRNPFDLYLQRQIEAKTWRLAKPKSDGEWLTYALP